VKRFRLTNKKPSKLEQICWWFLQQEQAYELYNDSGEHCDINQKLNYCELRFDYLKSAIRAHSKALSEALGSSDEPSSGKGAVLGLRLFRDESRERISTATECIELFARNLDFCLKLLKHENILLKNIYQRSAETRDDLASKLTIMVVASIMSEFEEFFVNEHDFGKLANNGEHVVSAIVRLILRVQHLKQKVNFINLFKI